jgi:hypothetical protein
VPAALLPATTWLRAPAAVAGKQEICADNIDARSTAPPLTIQHCTFQI